MELIVTPEIASKAKQFGACSVPPVGTPVSDLSVAQLVWVEDNDILSREEISSLPAPLWALSGYGDGDGSGYGYGAGDGAGAGSSIDVA